MEDTLVIDVETKKSFAEVGGEANKKDLGISVAGVYSYNSDKYLALEEHELPELERMLLGATHIIGFNIIHFDIPVMEPYFTDGVFDRIAVTDMFADATEFLGHRVGLNALAKTTLNTAKSSNGLEALQWFKEGRIEDVKKYCLDDVRITRDLYEYGRTNGFVLFESIHTGEKRSIPVSWGKEIKRPLLDILKEGFERRTRLRIQYVSADEDANFGFRKDRDIDIYEMHRDRIYAYCHLRKEPRNFYLKRIVGAELGEARYTLPQDAQGALFS